MKLIKNSKIVESRIHNEGQRVTLLYKGTGSFTFEFKKSKSLATKNKWQGVYKKQKFYVDLAFNNNHAKGKGRNEQDEEVKVEINLKPRKYNKWTGY